MSKAEPPKPTIDQTQEFKSLSTNLKATFKQSTPVLVDLLNDFPHLQKVAELFISFLSIIGTEKVQMTKSGVNLIDRTVRLLLSSSISMSKSAALTEQNLGNLRNSVEIRANIDTDDPEELKIRLEEALFQVEELSKKDAEHQKESAGLTQEIDELYRDSYKLQEKYCQTKRAYEDKLHQLYIENGQLKDELKEIKEHLKLQTEAHNNLKNQYEKALEEIEAEHKQNNSLKQSNSEKKKSIYDMKLEIETAQHINKELRLEQKRLLTELEAAKGDPVVLPSPVKRDALAEENVELKKKLRELTSIKEDRERQLSELLNEKQEENDKSEFEIQRLRTEMESHIDEANDKIEILTQKNADLIEEKEMIEDQLNERNDQLQKSEQDLEELSHRLSDLRKVFDDNEITPEEIPELVAKAKKNPQYQETIQKLRSSLDALGRLAEKLVGGEKIDAELLNQNEPLFEDEELRQQVLDKIKGFRSFVKQISDKDVDTVLLYDSIFGFTGNIEALIDNTIIKGENNIYTALIILVSLLNKAQNFITEQNDQLAEAYKELPYKQDGYTPKDLTEYVKSLKVPINKMKKLIKKEFDLYDSSATVADIFEYFLDNVESLINDFRSEVAPAIGFKRRISALPEAVKNEIESLNESIENTKVNSESALKSTVQQYEKTIQKIRSEMDEVKSKDRITASLREIIQKKDEAIKKIREELNEANDSRLETESAFNAFHAQKEEVEQNANVIKKQRDRLQQVLEQRQRTFNERMEKYKERTAQELQDEIDRVRNAQKKEMDRINEKIESKKQKIRTLKSRLEKNNKTKEDIIAHQRAEMTKLVEQNSKLIKKLSKAKQALDTSKTLSPLQSTTSVQNTISNTANASPTPTSNINPNPNTFTPISLNTSTTTTPTRTTMFSSTRTPSSISTPISSAQRSGSPTRQAMQELLQEIGKVLQPYCGVKSRWTKPRIIATINEVVQKVTGSKSIDADSEWQKWAASLIVSSKSNLTSAEMRIMIKDMVAGSTSRLKLMEKLQSLRYQKKILLTKTLPNRTYPIVCNAKILSCVVLFTKGLQKNVKKSRIITQSIQNSPGERAIVRSSIRHSLYK